MADRETALVNHVLASIRKDLDFLKQQQYLSPQAYAEIQRHLNVRAPGGIAGSPGSTYSPAPSRAPDMPSPASNPAAPPPDYKAVAGLGSAEALYDFIGPNPQDLSFRRGDIIQITEFVNDDWWRGSLHGKTGLFPSNYVKKIPQPPPAQEKGSSPPPPPPPSSDYGGYPPPPPSGGSGGGYSQPLPASPYGGGYPPPPVQSGSYAPPPSNTYAAPPAQSAPTAAPAAAPESSSHEEHGLSGMLKKVGGNVANAATWGFGGTIGSEAAHALF